MGWWCVDGGGDDLSNAFATLFPQGRFRARHNDYDDDDDNGNDDNNSPRHNDDEDDDDYDNDDENNGDDDDGDDGNNNDGGGDDDDNADENYSLSTDFDLCCFTNEGSDPGTLEVWAEEAEKPSKMVWSATGDAGNQWRVARVNMDTPFPFRVRIVCIDVTTTRV